MLVSEDGGAAEDGQDVGQVDLCLRPFEQEDAGVFQDSEAFVESVFHVGAPVGG